MEEEHGKKAKKRIWDKVLMGAVIGGAIGSVIGASISSKNTEKKLQEKALEEKTSKWRFIKRLFDRKKVDSSKDTIKIPNELEKK